MSDDKNPQRRYLALLCDMCVQGKGRECHAPACALYMNRAPEMRMVPEFLECLDSVPEDANVELLTTGRTSLVSEEGIPLSTIVRKAYSHALDLSSERANEILQERLGIIVIVGPDGLKYKLEIRALHILTLVSPDEEALLKKQLPVCADHLRECCEPCQEEDEE